MKTYIIYFLVGICCYLLFTKKTFADSPKDILEQVSKKHKIPAIAAAIYSKGEILMKEVVGERKWKSGVKASINDRFHIGSCTKSMTATLAGIMVKKDLIKWNATIGEIFPSEPIHSDYQKVTLKQLLSNASGVVGNIPLDLMMKLYQKAKDMTVQEQRLFFLREILKTPPSHKPGTHYEYSNAGFAIAGTMLEKVSKKSWEELIQVELFKPLSMDSASFGHPCSKDKIDNPWGHVRGFLKISPMGPTEKFPDNPPAIGPAGTVNCSISDLLKFAVFHTKRDESNSLLDKETFEILHKPIIKTGLSNLSYSLGWVVFPGEKLYMHNGSNTMNYALMMFSPEQEFAVVVMVNIYDHAGKIESITQNIVNELILHFRNKKSKDKKES